MDKFQILNRTAGQWEDVELVSGWNENFVIDKTTDTARVKLKYKGTEFPQIDNMDWCRLIHSEDGSVGYTESKFYKKYVWTKPEVKINFAINFPTNNNVKYDIEKTNILETFDKNIDIDVRIKIVFEGHTFYRTETFTLNEGTVYVTKNIDYSSLLFNSIDSLEIIEYSTSPEYLPVKDILGTEKYDYYYLPNYSQYLISNISMVKDIPNDEIDIQLDLIEPIEYLRGVVCETRSFSNQIEKEVDGDVYSHPKLNQLTVLEDLLKTTPANNDLSKSWYSRIKIADKDLLVNNDFNDDTYSEETLYNILLEKYDSLLGKTPVLYFDMNPTTDLPYNMDRPEFILKFERQDGLDKEEVELSVIEENATQEIVGKSLENYAKGLVTNYDNLSTKLKGYILANIIFAVPEVNSNDRDTTAYTAQNGDWVLRIPHKIKSVSKVIKYKIDTSSAVVGAFTLDVKDVTENTLTETQYNADANLYQSTNALWYAEGENVIHINEAKYVSNADIIWIYYVEYEPLIDGRIELGEEYLVPVNQTDAQIDVERFGEYLKKYLNGMNKADLTISKTVSEYKDIVGLGVRVVDGDKNYIITSVSVQNRGIEYEVVYQLNENHFRRNDSIQAPQEVRKNIDIGIDATKERNSAIKDTFRLSTKAFEDNETHFIDKSLVFSPLTFTYQDNLYPRVAKITFAGKLYKNVLGSAGRISVENFSKTLACEITRFLTGNTMWLNLRYFDNAEAGKTKTLNSKLEWDTDDHLYTIYGMPQSQIPVLYTDYFGEVDTLDISFNEISPSTDFTTPTSIKEISLNVMPALLISAKYPEPDIAGNEIFKVEDINYKKQRLETFNYSVGVEIKSDANIELCKAFYKYHNLLTTSATIDVITNEISIPISIFTTRLKCYNNNISEDNIENEEATDSAFITSHSYSDNQVTYTLDRTLQPCKCVAIMRGTEPLIIIRDFDKVKTEAFDSLNLFC